MCIFCKIINHEIPSYTIYEDEHYLAFLDITQATKGHTLIIPKKHVADFLEADETMLNEMMMIAQKIAHQLECKLGAKGFNILTNIHEIAGQSVHHFHLHIIPRYHENDGVLIEFQENNKNSIIETHHILTK